LAHPYSILLLATALINLLLAVYALRFIRSPGTLAYSILMACLSLYSFAYAYELQATTLQQIYFWLKIEYIGISMLPPLFIILAAQYTGMGHLLRPWLLAILFLTGLITLLLQVTNFGGFFYHEMKLNPDAPFPVADFVMGPWYWIHQSFANLMLLLSSILYIRMISITRGRNRTRALIMVFALDIPWLFYLIYLIGDSPYNIDLSPFSFSVVGILTALGIFRYQLLEFLPLALENVFNSMTDGVIILDEYKCLVSYNSSASGILPELSQSMKGKPVGKVISILPGLSNLKDGYESDMDITHLGKIRYFRMRVLAVRTAREKLSGWAIIYTDITDTKIKENALLEIEKELKELNENKDKFMALVAHDLRNAFHLIINMSEMILENIHKDDKQAALRKGKIIHDTAVSTFSLLQNLLEWALMQLRGVPFNPVNLQLSLLAETVIRQLKTQSDQKAIVIACSINSELKIHADEEMLKTVMRNLISNAIKYSYPGGEIHISATDGPEKIRVEISDNGMGMTKEEQQKLFRIESAFSKKGTASEDGTGLGLKLCKEFIGRHGGEIQVTSAPGEGSVFMFTMPVSPITNNGIPETFA
jgi:signal transduction histidine kinase